MSVSVSASDTLALWERAGGLAPPGRALALAAYDGTDTHELVDLPVGHAHARLLALREEAVGPQLQATAACPRCSARVEFGLDTRLLLGLHDQARAAAPASPPAGVTSCRPPTWADLEGLDAQDDADLALLRRCVVVADDKDPAELPADVVAEIEQLMMAADPLAELLVSSPCPECGLEFDASVDLAAFVWAEIEAAATRILYDVDILARAYGWTEPEVLGLSDRRRAAYLCLVLEGTP